MRPSVALRSSSTVIINFSIIVEANSSKVRSDLLSGCRGGELAQLVGHWSPVQATRVRFPVGASNPGCPIVEKGSMYTAELMTFPASAPQLVYQRPWYVLLCLCRVSDQ